LLPEKLFIGHSRLWKERDGRLDVGLRYVFIGMID
jgi:hypothetical protein